MFGNYSVKPVLCSPLSSCTDTTGNKCLAWRHVNSNCWGREEYSSLTLPKKFPSCCGDLGQIYGAAVSSRFWKQVRDRKRADLTPQTGGEYYGWRTLLSKDIKVRKVRLTCLNWQNRPFDHVNIWHGVFPVHVTKKQIMCTNAVGYCTK